MPNKYWSKKKKAEYSKALGEQIAITLFDDFGPNGNPTYRGLNFVYPNTLIEFVEGTCKTQALLHNIEDFERAIIDAGKNKMYELINSYNKHDAVSSALTIA